MAKVLAALSGGVDSSVMASLLVEQGHEVLGVTLRLWSEPGCEEENRCCTPESRVLAAQLADQLGIPFTVLDTSQLFRDRVVQPFLEGYTSGETPNPCMYCNRDLKWGYLLEYALEQGAQYIATGHYARLERKPNGHTLLYRGADPSKDQSYFLSFLSQRQLAHTLFPLGGMNKQQVREYARQHSLPAAEQSESQDLCFLGRRDYRDFLAEYAPDAVNPGDICTREGKVLGEHRGLAFYTIGQRKGLPASSRALYVLEKISASNQLIVGHEEELGRQEMRVRSLNWISGEPPGAAFRAEIQIRSQAPPVPASVKIIPGGQVTVQFERPLRDITPGQAAVLFRDDMVLGGGIINQEQAQASM